MRETITIGIGVEDMRYRWFDADREGGGTEGAKGFPSREEPAPVKKGRRGRTELFGALLAVVAFFYGAAAEDLPIIYLSMAFLAYELRFFTVLLGERASRFLNNLLWGLSVALFFGAIFMAFF